jgi:hypothetical protein
MKTVLIQMFLERREEDERTERHRTKQEQEMAFQEAQLADQVSSNEWSGSESGSTGSTCFWASWIRILLSLSINSKKNLDFYSFVTSF